VAGDSAKAMKITFVLPFSGRVPVGGVKVVYEYANQFVVMGHEVAVIHPAGLYLGIGKNDRWTRNLIKFFWYGLTKKYVPAAWFDLDRRVKLHWVPSLHALFLPKADVVVATAWETAEWVARYSGDRGQKFYLIQGFEAWSAERERVIKTWQLPFKKIVISRWLQKIAESLGEPSCCIQNGLDFVKFGVDLPPEDRNPHRFLMLYHDLEFKGVKDGIQALEQLRPQFPDIKLTLFGVTRPKPGELPDWVRFEQLPSIERLRALYNQAAIFIGPSWTEGWSLTSAEAMQCGCATVLTKNGGHEEFAIHEETSLLSPPKDVDAMARNIERLLQDNKYRVQLAHAGVAHIARFTWPRAAHLLESSFKAVIK
jgi:glycosyltransferase involved in cell wall biosynthesis